LRNHLSNLLSRYHLDRVPRTDREFVGIRLLLRNVNADFAAHTSLEINLTPGLIPLHASTRFVQENAIDGANLQARFATSAVICVDYGEFLGHFLAWSLLCHDVY